MQRDLTIPSAVQDHQVTGSVADIMVECYRDFGLLCKTLFPERFRAPYTSLHRKYIDLINAVLLDQQLAVASGKFAGRKLCVIGARGTAKSSFFTYALPARDILFGLSPFDVIATQAESNSIIQTENLRRTLTQNQLIRKIFGSVKQHAKDKDMQDTFGKSCWVAGNPGGYTAQFSRTMVLPRGMGQQIRGLLFQDHRPLHMYLDDLESMESLRNPAQRKKNFDWLEGDVVNCVNQFESENDPFLVIVSDTCKHEAAIVEQLAVDASWDTVRVAVCDANFKTLAPEFYSQEKMDEDVIRARKHGVMDVWAREHQSIPTAAEGKPFLRRLFQYYADTPAQYNAFLAAGTPTRLVDFTSSDFVSFVLVDPARTTNPTSAFSAIVGVSVNFAQPGIFFREVINERLAPVDLVRKSIDMVKRLRAYAIGVEYAGLHLHLEGLYEAAMKRYGIYDTILEELKPQAGKEEQAGYHSGKIARIIWGMSPTYHNHIIYHNIETCGVLEEQLLALPTSQYVDVADAASYIFQLLTILGLEFDAVGDDVDPLYNDMFDHPIKDAITVQATEKWDELEYAEWNTPIELSDNPMLAEV